MKTEMYVYFSLYDLTCEPDDITKTLRVAPTSVTRVGDLIGKVARMKSKSNSWQVRVDAKTHLKLDLLLKRLLERLPPIASIKRAARYGTPNLVCVLYSVDRSAELWLSIEVIKKISALNCSFEIDQYYLPGE